MGTYKAFHSNQKRLEQLVRGNIELTRVLNDHVNALTATIHRMEGMMLAAPPSTHHPALRLQIPPDPYALHRDTSAVVPPAPRHAHSASCTNQVPESHAPLGGLQVDPLAQFFAEAEAVTMDESSTFSSGTGEYEESEYTAPKKTCRKDESSTTHDDTDDGLKEFIHPINATNAESATTLPPPPPPPPFGGVPDASSPRSVVDVCERPTTTDHALPLTPPLIEMPDDTASVSHATAESFTNFVTATVGQAQAEIQKLNQIFPNPMGLTVTGLEARNCKLKTIRTRLTTNLQDGLRYYDIDPDGGVESDNPQFQAAIQVCVYIELCHRQCCLDEREYAARQSSNEGVGTSEEDSDESNATPRSPNRVSLRRRIAECVAAHEKIPADLIPTTLQLHTIKSILVPAI